jgi:hypothetical protein
MLRLSDPTCHWLWYMYSAKHVALSASFGDINEESDISVIFRWIYYHDLMSRFTLRYRRLRLSAEAAYFKDFNQLPVCSDLIKASPAT